MSAVASADTETLVMWTVPANPYAEIISMRPLTAAEIHAFSDEDLKLLDRGLIPWMTCRKVRS